MEQGQPEGPLMVFVTEEGVIALGVIVVATVALLTNRVDGAAWQLFALRPREGFCGAGRQEARSEWKQAFLIRGCRKVVGSAILGATSTRSLSVTTTWARGLSMAFSGPEDDAGTNNFSCPSATVASAIFMTNCGSTPWPRCVPVARTGMSGTVVSHARSSAVAGSAPVAPEITATRPETGTWRRYEKVVRFVG